MIRRDKDVEKIPMTLPGAYGSSMKALIGPDEGWEGYVMRKVELGPGGKSPHHQHPWPHINYVIEGEGVLLLGESENPIGEGDAAYVPPQTLHQYQNTGDSPLRFLCIVPKEGHIL